MLLTISLSSRYKFKIVNWKSLLLDYVFPVLPNYYEVNGGLKNDMLMQPLWSLELLSVISF